MTKPIKDSGLCRELLLEFEVAFPGEKRLTIEQYLNGSSRDQNLKAASFFLSFKNDHSKFADSREFLLMFFQEQNNVFANQIYNTIYELEKDDNHVAIINPYSSLKLFEYYFSKPTEPVTQSDVESEINLFKAYLVLNSELTEKQAAGLSSAEESDDRLKLAMSLFCIQYPVYDKLNYDIKQIWVTQIIKAIYLFQFLESHDKTKSLLAAFLSYFNCLTWQDYLKDLMPLTFPAILNETEAHTDIVVGPGNNFEAGCAFIEKFIVEEIDKLDQDDFLTIRAKPFYKIQDGVYRIIFNLFVVEKIFKGVYFLLRDVNNKLPVEIRFSDLKSFYGFEFTEKILCYKVMESIYSDKYIRYSGKQMDDMGMEAAPDYYMRKGKNILLVESKDFLIPAVKKMSFDFNIYEQEFGRVLDYEENSQGKRKPKAVMQLASSIRRILKSQFIADTCYYYKDIFIYPILLVYDSQYEAAGFNELIDFWFQEELVQLQKQGLFIHHVKPLAVVSIDSLIYNQIGLRDRIELHDILKLYHESKIVLKPKKIKYFRSLEEENQYLNEYEEMRLSKFNSFSVFIDKYFSNLGIWKVPPIMDFVGPALFGDEYGTKDVENASV